MAVPAALYSNMFMTWPEAVVVARGIRTEAKADPANNDQFVVPIIPQFRQYAEQVKQQELGRLYPISIASVSASSQNVSGCVLIKKQHAQIIVDAHTLCWKRFVICKELFHILWSWEEGHVPSDPRINLGFSRQRDRIYLEKDTKTPLPLELICFIQAVEFMLPWSQREQMHNMYDQQNLSFYQIAKHFMVPEAIIYMYFSTPYRARSVEINEQMPSL